MRNVEKLTKSWRHKWHHHLSVRKYKNDENRKIIYKK